MKNFYIVSVIIVLVVGGLIFLISSGGDEKSSPTVNKNETMKNSESESMSQKQYSKAPEILTEAERIGKKARFETNQGSFTITLFGDKAPKTVSNFIFLVKDGFYDDLIFHRVLADFMIQGGDPDGVGTGGPGYRFEDELDDSLTFSKKGILAMANSGPATNGSQFFITVAPTPHLNGLHTIFGEVIEGYDIVEKISKVQTGTSDKPADPVIITKIKII